MTFDGVNYYYYDAEERICAIQSYLVTGVAAYGYLYDADGTRVAKGTVTPTPYPATQPISCDPLKTASSSVRLRTRHQRRRTDYA